MAQNFRVMNGAKGARENETCQYDECNELTRQRRSYWSKLEDKRQQPNSCSSEERSLALEDRLHGIPPTSDVTSNCYIVMHRPINRHYKGIEVGRCRVRSPPTSHWCFIWSHRPRFDRSGSRATTPDCRLSGCSGRTRSSMSKRRAPKVNLMDVMDVS